MLEYSLSRICFLCLNDSDKCLQNVFSEDEDNILIMNKIEYLISSDLLMLEPENPEFICSSCIRKLNSFYEFKQSCLENGRRLKKFINSAKTAQTSINNYNLNNSEGSLPSTTENFTEEYESTNCSTHEEEIVEDSNKSDNTVLDLDNTNKSAKVAYVKQEIVEFCEENSEDSYENHREIKIEPINLHEDQDNDDMDVQEIDENEDEECLVPNIDIKEEFIEFSNEADNNIYNELLDTIGSQTNDANISEPDQNNVTQNTTKDNRFQCSKCDKSYKNKTHLFRHAKIHLAVLEATPKETFKCDICDKEFGRSHNLQRHIQTHTNVKKYECTVCNHTFQQKGNLTRHLETHEFKRINIKKFYCPECDHEFSEKVALTKHLKSHANDKNLKCSVCEMRFSRKDVMLKHERSHLDTEGYRCEICNKYYQRKDYFTNHKKYHDGIRNYECNNCQKTFVTKATLKTHMHVHK